MARKMSNKCHSICVAARCFAILPDASVGDLIARFFFLRGTAVFNLRDKGTK